MFFFYYLSNNHIVMWKYNGITFYRAILFAEYFDMQVHFTCVAFFRDVTWLQTRSKSNINTDSQLIDQINQKINIFINLPVMGTACINFPSLKTPLLFLKMSKEACILYSSDDF